jgi:hypothetical protein
MGGSLPVSAGPALGMGRVCAVRRIGMFPEAII